MKHKNAYSKVSVVIPIYNEEMNIINLLKSLKQQDYP